MSFMIGTDMLNDLAESAKVEWGTGGGWGQGEKVR